LLIVLISHYLFDAIYFYQFIFQLYQCFLYCYILFWVFFMINISFYDNLCVYDPFFAIAKVASHVICWQFNRTESALKIAPAKNRCSVLSEGKSKSKSNGEGESKGKGKGKGEGKVKAKEKREGEGKGKVEARARVRARARTRARARARARATGGQGQGQRQG
jgi:hypothetical protein